MNVYTSQHKSLVGGSPSFYNCYIAARVLCLFIAQMYLVAARVSLSGH